MPTYNYECYDCKTVREEFHSINENPYIFCHICEGKTRKVILEAPLMRMSNYDRQGKWCGDSTKEIKKTSKK